jgi:hypothetical protein
MGQYMGPWAMGQQLAVRSDTVAMPMPVLTKPLGFRIDSKLPAIQHTHTLSFITQPAKPLQHT